MFCLLSCRSFRALPAYFNLKVAGKMAMDPVSITFFAESKELNSELYRLSAQGNNWYQFFEYD